MSNWFIALAFSSAVVSFSLTSSAQASKDESKQTLSTTEIMKRVEEFDDGDDLTADIELTLIDRYGSERVFKMRQMRKYFGPEKKDRYTRNVFYQPQQLLDVSVLSIDYDDVKKRDDRWIFIPEVETVKRITSEETGKQMGSDISYADLNPRKTEDYKYKLLKEERVREWDTWQIEFIPKTEEIMKRFGYTKGIVWVDKNSYRIVRSVFWVAEKQKTRKYYDVYTMKEIDGIWTPVDVLFMTKRGADMIHITKMKLHNVKYFNDVPEHVFEIDDLGKALPERFRLMAYSQKTP